MLTKERPGGKTKGQKRTSGGSPDQDQQRDPGKRVLLLGFLPKERHPTARAWDGPGRAVRAPAAS
jgi:hypothetical protein